MRAVLVWNLRFASSMKTAFSSAQDVIDKQCVKRMTEFVPVALPKYPKAGMLRDSVKIEEPGHIIYTAPHAVHQYYDDLNHKGTGNPKAQRYWFEVMKMKYIGDIADEANKVLGARR